MSACPDHGPTLSTQRRSSRRRFQFHNTAIRWTDRAAPFDASYLREDESQKRPGQPPKSRRRPPLPSIPCWVLLVSASFRERYRCSSPPAWQPRRRSLSRYIAGTAGCTKSKSVSLSISSALSGPERMTIPFRVSSRLPCRQRRSSISPDAPLPLYASQTSCASSRAGSLRPRFALWTRPMSRWNV